MNILGFPVTLFLSTVLWALRRLMSGVENLSAPGLCATSQFILWSTMKVNEACARPPYVTWHKLDHQSTAHTELLYHVASLNINILGSVFIALPFFQSGGRCRIINIYPDVGLPVAAEKLAVRTMDNSLCLRPLSIKLSAKKMWAGYLKSKHLSSIREFHLSEAKIDQKFSISWEPHIHRLKVLFFGTGTPC